MEKLRNGGKMGPPLEMKFFSPFLEPIGHEKMEKWGRFGGGLRAAGPNTSVSASSPVSSPSPYQLSFL